MGLRGHSAVLLWGGCRDRTAGWSARRTERGWIGWPARARVVGLGGDAVTAKRDGLARSQVSWRDWVACWRLDYSAGRPPLLRAAEGVIDRKSRCVCPVPEKAEHPNQLPATA